jgi:polyhydroxyalkanoate synthesis regulator phasin
MLENLKKSIDKGLDYAVMTSEKMTKAAKEMAKENNLTKEEAKKLLEYLVKKSEEAKKSMGSDLHDIVKSAMKKMDIPTKEEIKKLEERIKKLEGYHKTAVKPAAKPTPVKKSIPVAAKKKTRKS